MYGDIIYVFHVYLSICFLRMSKIVIKSNGKFQLPENKGGPFIVKKSGSRYVSTYETI